MYDCIVIVSIFVNYIIVIFSSSVISVFLALPPQIFFQGFLPSNRSRPTPYLRDEGPGNEFVAALDPEDSSIQFDHFRANLDGRIYFCGNETPPWML